MANVGFMAYLIQLIQEETQPLGCHLPHFHELHANLTQLEVRMPVGQGDTNWGCHGHEQQLVGSGDDARPLAEPVPVPVQPDGDVPAQRPVVGPNGGVPNCEDRPVRKKTPNTKYPSEIYDLHSTRMRSRKSHILEL